MDGEDQKPSLESPLISQEAVSHSRNGAKREEILGEVKKQLKIAGPLMLVNVLLYSLQVISVMFVGHLGELALWCFHGHFLCFSHWLQLDCK
ncbi:hypothetical protein AAG906_025554 [Vitis piasezkii]